MSYIDTQSRLLAGIETGDQGRKPAFVAVSRPRGPDFAALAASGLTIWIGLAALSATTLLLCSIAAGALSAL